MKKISLLVPELPTAAELVPFLHKIDSAHWYSNYGPLVCELENKLLRLMPGQGSGLYATSVSNCTAGLELALIAQGLPRGSRVLVPALTFVATATAIMRAGLEPVLCDVDEKSWLLTPGIAERAVRMTGAEAVMPVSTYGCSHDPREWAAWNEASGVPVIVDAAGAFGNQWPAPGATYVYSLHATKVFSSGEGGLVVSGDARIVQDVKKLTNFGIEAGSGLVSIAGTNAKMSEYHAAVGLAMLANWERYAERRRALHSTYVRCLGTIPGIALQARESEGIFSIMPVMLPASMSAASAGAQLMDLGIETRRWYCPMLPEHPAFRDAKVAGDLHVARQLSERLLALPFHLHMTAEEIEYVCERLAFVLKHSGA